MGMHFGHCDVFTLVSIEENEVKEVSTLINPPHEQGGCLAPVQLLASQGVKALLAGGMGFRPLMAFNQVGIKAFYSGTFTKVGDAVKAFLAGQLPEFSQEHTCHGGH
ncbi:MAG: NifB/NifX family molybdenum-iron cluster-binding protein [Desulfovibrio sp.]|nr:NifB/NifX family molybdenum-iron cluster-binding protein [Desulfovibrio sp.]